MIFWSRAYSALLRLGFHLLYNELAWTYDSALDHLLGPRVLEVGFGTGDILMDLKEAGFTAYGLDKSPYMIAITRRKLQKAGLTVPICRGAVPSLPFADGVFDSVLATFPPPFIRAETTLQEFARVLQPAGRLVVVDYASLQRPALTARFIGWLYEITGQRPQWYSSQLGWLREMGWDATEYERQLESSVVHLWIAKRPNPA
jgi:ubiquinone/menaquinone biosynthesis C-methylase UbiE